MCSTIDERNVETAFNAIRHFENKGSDESMLNQNLRVNLKLIQHVFNKL